jgi:signal peptidase II
VVREGEILLVLTSVVFVVAVDQVLKAAVLHTGRVLQVGPLLRIRSVRSEVAMVSGFGLRIGVLVLAWLGIAVTVVLFAVPHSGLFHSSLSILALGAALGGAASNLLDHALRGTVVDYVDLRVWPVFNLADAAVVSGVLVAFIAR